jgi:pre-mRNA-splicing factor SYF2
MPATRTSKRSKKSTAKVVEELPEARQEPEPEPEREEEQGMMVDMAEAAEKFVDKMMGVENGSSTEVNGGGDDDGERREDATTNGSDPPKLTMEERKAKLALLRKKIVCLICLRLVTRLCPLSSFLKDASAKANRASLVEESAKAKVTARDAARLDRQRKVAEVLRQKADAEERGEDVQRQKNWEWTIEENDNWEKKLARKARRADFEFHGELLHQSWFLSVDTVSLQTMHMQQDGGTRKIWTSSSLTWLLITNRRKSLWD